MTDYGVRKSTASGSPPVLQPASDHPAVCVSHEVLTHVLGVPLRQALHLDLHQSRFRSLKGWYSTSVNAKRVAKMLLSYQSGNVRVGEVVRYTLSYNPAVDPIYPPPEKLYVKIRNTSPIPLRAAYLHGPYTLYAACYPSTFDPNVKYDQQDTDGVPQFEPYLKAGGSWDATITVPQRIHRTPTELVSADPESHQSVTWVIEIVSQVIFSGTAAVNFEVLVGRDEKSVQMFTASGASSAGLPLPVQLQDHWSSKPKGEQVLATAGVYSKSITLRVDDTASLWNSPPFPSFEEDREACTAAEMQKTAERQIDTPQKKNPKKNIHLVVLTHGLHSNLGADMLYLKETIDAAAKKAREQAKKDRQESETSQGPKACSSMGSSNSNLTDSNDDNDEQIIVRGFHGNSVRTERGIQYLGKRLAKYVLLMTYPDQPYLPTKASKAKSFSKPLNAWKATTEHPMDESSVSNCEQESNSEDHAYRITSISFIGHSLGGLIQTYAIAYIQKYSPQFFDRIKPISFITLATPFLGLSNENPVYVRFALDLGLVGRTGQDLGLSWTAPKVRSGWGAIIGGKGEAVKPEGHPDPGSKPLLRILPCGPAHEVLAKFQHRTIYSNVVNDGIVPLRTSSMFFLDWRGLGRVEKARRDNGLVGTMAEWGWAELTGANSKSPQSTRPALGETSAESGRFTRDASVLTLTQQQHENGDNTVPHAPEQSQFLESQHLKSHVTPVDSNFKGTPSRNYSFSPLGSFLSLFRPKGTNTMAGSKQTKIFNRSQTLRAENPSEVLSSTRPNAIEASFHPSSNEDGLHTPPKTTFFESASDLLMPPLPTIDFILNPASRARTIFHDRIYHPEDIPPPLPVKRRTLQYGSPQSKSSKAQSAPSVGLPYTSYHNKDESESGLRVEEKIARAYHRDLSWRKVLVRLEPDAHNNIIVRRMFTNAYGWPVVKHLVDTHFGYTSTAQTRDVLEGGVDRAKSPMAKTTRSGNEVRGQTDPPGQEGSIENLREHNPNGLSQSLRVYQARPNSRPKEPTSQTKEYLEEVSNPDSVKWSDHDFGDDDEADDDDEDGDNEAHGFESRFNGGNQRRLTSQHQP